MLGTISFICAGAPPLGPEATSQRVVQPAEADQSYAMHPPVLGATGAEAKCPEAGGAKPIGLLYNHVSKTGGTTFKHYLQAV